MNRPNVNQNYYPMEVWIWNHIQNKSGKLADPTSVEIPQDKSK